jgi:serine protease Do
MRWTRGLRAGLYTVACVSVIEAAIGAQQGPPPSPRSLGSTLFARLSPAIVSVETFEDGQSQPARFGTAVLVFGQSVAVTNAHVLVNASRIAVRTASARTAAAEIVYVDVDRDVAVLMPNADLSSESRDFPIASQEPAIGKHVFAISNPLGMERSLTEGIVSSIRQFQGLGRVVQHTAAISPGSSGGALFDDSGTLVGIVSAQLPQGQSLNFAITSLTILDALEQWVEAGQVERAKLSPSEYATRTRRRFPEFGDLSDQQLLGEIAKRRPTGSGVPAVLRTGREASPIDALVLRIDQVFSDYREAAEKVAANGLSENAAATLATENGRRIQLLRATNAPTQASRDAVALLLSACESVQRRLTSSRSTLNAATDDELVLLESRQMYEAFSMLAGEAQAQSISEDSRFRIRGYLDGIQAQIALFERTRATRVSNPEGTWIDDGGLESRTRVATPPLTIAVGRDGIYYMTGGTANVSTQDISYVVSAQLQRVGTRLSGPIMVGYYMRSASDRYACSSTGTLDMALSQDGSLLSGTSLLSHQPNSVPSPFALLCSSLPSGTRTIRLTRR